MNKNVYLQDLGLIDYLKAWDYQESLLQKIAKIKIENRHSEKLKPTPNYILLVEHPHVYTLGKSGDKSHLLANESLLEKKGAKFYKINRGGDITYHGPGQLVGYPVMDLENFFTDINKYLRFIEEIIIKTLADYELKGERSYGETGVWLDVGTPFARKICAIGIRTSRWIAMHGFALNINTDMNYFNHIVPCGIREKSVTSLQKELNRSIPMEEVKAKVLKYFKTVFEVSFIEET